MRSSSHVLNMAATRVPLAFSPNVEFCAYSSPDGSLKLWETNTGSLKQEYIPSSHLSATCSCLSWGPSKAQVEKTSVISSKRTVFDFLKSQKIGSVKVRIRSFKVRNSGSRVPKVRIRSFKVWNSSSQVPSLDPEF